MYRFWITKIFQTSILFEINKFHHGGPPWSGGPGAIAPVAPPPLIRPCHQCMMQAARTNESCLDWLLTCRNATWTVSFIHFHIRFSPRRLAGATAQGGLEILNGFPQPSSQKCNNARCHLVLGWPLGRFPLDVASRTRLVTRSWGILVMSVSGCF